ncbi:DUF2604 domain-containing protein [Draconibacterium sediminis]|uniref:DUF2604 domain-containing protein n=1 Tax=Draconibacterium sediminis TaxID=1544798 RepID=UPI0026EFA0D8|nr:DUF2604 domain-containing protein [Draconibacterium sediminis]
MNNEKKQHNLISLRFSVTGKPVVTIEKVNVNQPLQVSVEKALVKTGSTRPIKDYDVLFNNNILDITQRIETLELIEGVLLMVSLSSGKGGK